MRNCVVILLIFSLLLSSCVGNRTFSLAELTNDEAQHQKVLGKQIELHKKNDEVVICYLVSVENDSLVVSMKKNDESGQLGCSILGRTR